MSPRKIDELYKAIEALSDGETNPDRLQAFGKVKTLYESARKEEDEKEEKYLELAKNYRDAILSSPVTEKEPEEVSAPKEVHDFNYYLNQRKEN